MYAFQILELNFCAICFFREISQDEEIAFLDSYMMLKRVWKRLKIKTKINETFREFKLKLVQHKSGKRKSTTDEDTLKYARHVQKSAHFSDQVSEST